MALNSHLSEDMRPHYSTVSRREKSEAVAKVIDLAGYREAMGRDCLKSEGGEAPPTRQASERASTVAKGSRPAQHLFGARDSTSSMGTDNATLVSRIEIDEQGAMIVYRIPGTPRPPGVPDPGAEIPVLPVASMGSWRTENWSSPGEPLSRRSRGLGGAGSPY